MLYSKKCKNCHSKNALFNSQMGTFDTFTSPLIAFFPHSHLLQTRFEHFNFAVVLIKRVKHNSIFVAS